MKYKRLTTISEITDNPTLKALCESCAQMFEKDSIILAAYGLLFCSIDCVQKKFPDADLNYVEEILASDIGVK